MSSNLPDSPKLSCFQDYLDADSAIVQWKTYQAESADRLLRQYFTPGQTIKNKTSGRTYTILEITFSAQAGQACVSARIGNKGAPLKITLGVLLSDWIF